MDSIEQVVLLPFYNDSIDDIEDIPNSLTLETFLNKGELDQSFSKELAFEQVPFSHPLVILFSSGTTGIPKCIGNKKNN